MAASPEALGDAKTETKEDLSDRQAQALLGCCGLLAELAGCAGAEALPDVQRLLVSPAFLKAVMTHASRALRRAAYRLMAEVGRRKLLSEVREGMHPSLSLCGGTSYASVIAPA